MVKYPNYRNGSSMNKSRALSPVQEAQRGSFSALRADAAADAYGFKLEMQDYDFGEPLPVAVHLFHEAIHVGLFVAFDIDSNLAWFGQGIIAVCRPLTSSV